MYLVTAEQMRAIDRETIDNRGIPGPELMENAGRGIAEAMLDDIIEDPDEVAVAIFCGKGNNGGDGFVVGRYLYEAGADVSVFFLGPFDKLSEDAALNFERARAAGIEMCEIRSAGDLPDGFECDVIVDAIFGTGFSGAPRGVAAEMIDFINLQYDTPVVAIDTPSGVNADTGAADGAAVKADVTFTLALPKFGLYVSPGRELSGTVSTIPIGIPDNVVEAMAPRVSVITPEDVMDALPVRPADGHKGTFGRLFLLAGSTGFTGAATLAAEAANRTGCGLIKLGCPKAVQPVLATKLTEVMTWGMPDVARKGALALRGLGEIRTAVAESDALVIGPGIGTHRETKELLHRLLEKLDKPAIIDADGLNVLAGHDEIIAACPAPLVLTPHPGEFARLSGLPVAADIHGRIAQVQEYARKVDAVIVYKASPSLIGLPDGRVLVNQSGNEGMATGGSGDVLSGMIGSLLAQGLDPATAAMAGVFIHGLAGDLAAERLTPRAMVAGDIIDYLPAAFEMLGE
jgi:NAD(P)H-hydrate epimerase